jgi:hypothetical protein
MTLAEARRDVEHAIANGRTLPARFYGSEDILRLEQQHVFERLCDRQGRPHPGRRGPRPRR